MGKIEFDIDDVIKDSNGLTIRGYCMDDGRADFDVISSAGESLDCEISRYKYKNVFVSRIEAESKEAAGFIIKLPRFERRLRLSISLDGDNEIVPIKLMHDFSKRSVSGYMDALFINLRKVKKSLKKRGIIGTIIKAFKKIFMPDRSYERFLLRTALSPEDIKAQSDTVFDYNPLFSIIVPLYETPENFLLELIGSLKAQTYPNWELCFSDGSRDSVRLKGIISREMEIDSRIKYTDKRPGPLGISSNTNQALEISEGDYIVLGDHDDLFTVDALYECVKVLNENKVDIIYTDEDKTDITSSKFFEPHFKPDFNIGFFRSNNYICHMFVVSKQIANKVGAFNDEYNGAQDYDYILRCTENADSIVHIPKILYHWRFHMDSTAAMPESKLYAYEAGRKALEAHYKRLGIDAEVNMGRDYGYYNTRFPIIGEPNVSVITITPEMSVEEINNAAMDTDGDYLLFIDSRARLIADSGFDNAYDPMLMHLMSPDVGAVGARIFYPDETIASAGMILGMYGAYGWIFEGQKEIDIYHGRSHYLSDYSGVSGICMMTKRQLFLSNPFDTNFKSSAYDMDYCLRLRQKGRRIVYQPMTSVIYSGPRPDWHTDTNDRKRFMSKWDMLLKSPDSYYNINVSLDRADYKVK